MKTNINGNVVRYEDMGAGPAILILHDGPSNRDIAQVFRPLIDAGYRVVSTHLDGYGKRRASALELPSYARDAVSLLNYLGIGRAVTFGIGVGGIVLLEMLDSCPGRVAASSLVFGPATAKQIRKLASRPDINAALEDGRFKDLKKEFLSTLPTARKEKAAQVALPRLQTWIKSIGSRNLYLSAITHRSALLVDMDIPPLILEAEETTTGGPGNASSRKDSIASRGWKKIMGVNACLAALIQLFSCQDEELEEEEILSHPH